ncbi:hypothetical protein N405_00140 [Helicobacter pylori FD568]|nr:hypothetical protein N405_00140 [Helicobacter pylori FD568]
MKFLFKPKPFFKSYPLSKIPIIFKIELLAFLENNKKFVKNQAIAF